MFLGKKKKTSAYEHSRIEQLESEIQKLGKLLAIKKSDIALDLSVIQKVFDIARLGYWIQPIGRQSLTLSEKAQELLGYKEKHAINYSELLACIHPDDVSVVEDALRSVSSDNKPVELGFRVISSVNESKETKNYFCKVTRFSHADQDQSYIIAVFGDNTQQEKSRRELIRAKEKAEESERLKNTLLTNISHEIRTPMNSIIGFSELLKIGNLSYETKREYVNTIRNQGNLLLKFIDDIVELIKFESGKVKISRTKCNLNILLKEIRLNTNQQKVSYNKESLDIKLEMPDKTGLVIITDPGRLQQVISNLINNSIKFTEKGFIEFGYKLPVEEKIEFYVRDTGIGLSKEQQKNIFNRFAEKEIIARTYEGSGLGLTLSKHLVKLMGGRIWVDSEPGKGSVFHFTIPFELAATESHDYAITEDERLPAYNWKDKVILIVEDDEINFRFLEAILHDTDTQLIHATTGSQAVELCKSINKIDLILMDIKLPEMDGFEATIQIRQFNKKMPIIAQTAFVTEIDLEQCRAAGCNEIITKPIDIREFLDKINVFLRDS